MVSCFCDVNVDGNLEQITHYRSSDPPNSTGILFYSSNQYVGINFMPHYSFVIYASYKARFRRCTSHEPNRIQ